MIRIKRIFFLNSFIQPVFPRFKMRRMFGKQPFRKSAKLSVRQTKKNCVVNGNFAER